MEVLTRVYPLLKNVFLNKAMSTGPFKGRLKQVLRARKILGNDQGYKIPLLKKAIEIADQKFLQWKKVQIILIEVKDKKIL